MKEEKQNKKRNNSKIGYLLIFLLLLTIGILLVVWQNTLTGLAIAIGSVLALFGIIFTGILILAFQNCDCNFWIKNKHFVSLILSAAGTVCFMMTLQPYAAFFCFVFLVIKAIMLIKRR